MASPDRSQQSSGEDDDARSVQHARKRKRVALACSTCRERKVRCDGGKPVCTPCSKRGALEHECTYALLSRSAQRTSEQDYIASLQQQVRALRAAQPSFTPPPPPPPPPPAAAHTSHHPPQPAADTSSATSLLLSHVASSAATTATTNNNNNNNNDVDALPAHPVSAMGATMMAGDSGALPRANEYYGASSLVSLIHRVASPSAPRDPRSTSHPHGPAGTLRPRTVASNASAASSSIASMLNPQYALPPRRLADELLALYFDNNHIFYPWTHSHTFRQRYESLWNPHPPLIPDASTGDVGLGGHACPENIFICALNAMFALGCQFSDYPSADKDAASATFCDRVRGLLQFDLLDNGSIACVQALLLFGLYLQSTNFPERCWNIIGLAYRMAVGLGLQSAVPPDDATPLEIAMRRRVWHACVQMDTYVHFIQPHCIAR